MHHLWPAEQIELCLHGQDAEALVWVANHRLLMRALSNILRNACRYAQQHICVEFQITADQLCFRIADDGPGIPEAQRHLVFTPFYRIDESRDRNSGGMGLGLAICQQAVLVLGGSVELTQSAWGGAEFVVRLPRQLTSTNS